jgi:hypothetical protein
VVTDARRLDQVERLAKQVRHQGGRSQPDAHNDRVAAGTNRLPSDLLGKQRLSDRHEHGWTYPRDVLEVLEGMDDVPLPARCGFRAVPGGVAVEALVRADTPALRRKITHGLEESGLA